MYVILLSHEWSLQQNLGKITMAVSCAETMHRVKIILQYKLLYNPMLNGADIDKICYE